MHSMELQAFSRSHDGASQSDVHVPSLRAAALHDARIILSRSVVNFPRGTLGIWNSLFKGRMMRPENATAGQQYKRTYAPGARGRAGLRGEIVNSNVFSVSTWQHPRFASRRPSRAQCLAPLPLRWTKSRKPYK